MLLHRKSLWISDHEASKSLVRVSLSDSFDQEFKGWTWTSDSQNREALSKLDMILKMLVLIWNCSRRK